MAFVSGPTGHFPTGQQSEVLLERGQSMCCGGQMVVELLSETRIGTDAGELC